MQTDVIKHMLQKPILSGRIGKWAYALVEYDLACEHLKSMRGKIVADFIVEHRICRYPVAGIPTLTAARQDPHSYP